MNSARLGIENLFLVNYEVSPCSASGLQVIASLNTDYGQALMK